MRLSLWNAANLCENRNHVAKISSHAVFFNNLKYQIVKSKRCVLKVLYNTLSVIAKALLATLRTQGSH